MSKNALINEYIAPTRAIIVENNQTKAKNFVIEQTEIVFENINKLTEDIFSASEKTD